MPQVRPGAKCLSRCWTLILAFSCLTVVVIRPVFSQTTNYDFNYNLSVTNAVYTIALQPDSKILVGALAHPFRLLTNGSLDSTFDPELIGSVFPRVREGSCNTIGVQDDGKILLGGDFISMKGQWHTNLGRLNPDGSPDTNFTANAKSNPAFAFAFDALGRKLVGGAFTELAGNFCAGLGRLTANDQFDLSMDAGNGTVFSLAVQDDDKILVGGFFSSLAGQPSTNLGRLNSNGTLDPSFNAQSILSEVECFAGQADGKILAGATASSGNGLMTNIIRFSSSGELDTQFNPGANHSVVSLAVQTDGKIILGGSFTSLGGQPRMGIGRINSDGSIDTNFVPIAYKRVYSLALQDDGKILIGGQLVDGTGQTNFYVGRLQNTSVATQSLSYQGSTIIWMRGGTSPEVWRTTFQSSTDGTNWNELGQGVRIEGGWQLTNLIIPAGSTIRARGRVMSGQYNGTSWFVETRLQLPPPLKIVTDNPNFGFRSNRFGFDLIGPSNSIIAIESSLDLSDWLPLVTKMIQSGSLHFSDPAGESKTFYRLRLVQ